MVKPMTVSSSLPDSVGVGDTITYESKLIHITREEYDAMTRKERKRYYWHDGRLCLRKVYR